MTTGYLRSAKNVTGLVLAAAAPALALFGFFGVVAAVALMPLLYAVGALFAPARRDPQYPAAGSNNATLLFSGTGVKDQHIFQSRDFGQPNDRFACLGPIRVASRRQDYANGRCRAPLWRNLPQTAGYCGF